MKWFTKRSNRRVRLDVGVHAYKTNKGERRVCFYFRDGIHKKLAPSGKLIIGLDNKRIYLKDSEDGWTVQVLGDTYAQLSSGNPLIFRWAMNNGTEFILEEDKNGYFIEGVNGIGKDESDDGC